MTTQEFIIGCEHDGSYVPVGEVIRLLDEFAELRLEEFKESAHYKWLLERESWLTCLESAGVDNWSGYEHAIDIRDEYNDDNA